MPEIKTLEIAATEAKKGDRLHNKALAEVVAVSTGPKNVKLTYGTEAKNTYVAVDSKIVVDRAYETPDEEAARKQANHEEYMCFVGKTVIRDLMHAEDRIAAARAEFSERVLKDGVAEAMRWGNIESSIKAEVQAGKWMRVRDLFANTVVPMTLWEAINVVRARTVRNLLERGVDDGSTSAASNFAARAKYDGEREWAAGSSYANPVQYAEQWAARTEAQILEEAEAIREARKAEA